ncbi:hypothetical protein AYI68_g3244 [Smittium mucronatum]|uniref:Uncharacterized protein n=1 Tax=Smittium mucronatum TaxID=133383 RepID=A0A1R0H0H1_9FUNG|nr:hypothetical protein AYI68_g3244 [Smittium mucronatum]
MTDELAKFLAIAASALIYSVSKNSSEVSLSLEHILDFKISQEIEFLVINTDSFPNGYSHVALIITSQGKSVSQFLETF